MLTTSCSQALMFKVLSQNVSGMFFRVVKEIYINNNIFVLKLTIAKEQSL